MSFPLDTPYFQIPGSQPEATFGAIMEMLLKTRLKLHLETNQDLYDEDVNAYLAGLLVSYIDPNYLKAVSEVLSHYDVDIYQSVRKAEDRYQAYWIYKVNADDLLVSLGVFRKLWQESKGELSRMKRYYIYASEYQHRIYGKSTAVGEIQVKLAEWTERYLAILSGTRQEYLNLIESAIKPSDLAVLSQHISQFEEALPFKTALDQFLDVYSSWLKGSRESALRQKLLYLLDELQRLDPTFQPESILSHLRIT